ncbi:ribose-5-phosphate isomerase RpiA [Georgenia alba]|uniref:Ribose-5-phosphate isomerase A n=1 Tax=Georgenia alba TaxID=2233858 RepID=A0ABW2Q439_9MICO
MTPQDRAKQHVGRAAVERYVRPGMLLGLGSGTTSHWFVRALGEAVADGLEVRGIPTSRSTEELARSLDVPLVGFDEIDRIELVVDGPDEVDHDGHMTKGGGACLLWERIVADAAERYLCVADTTKLVERLGAFPVPIEVVRHGWESTGRSVRRLLSHHGYPDAPITLRTKDGEPVVTDSGNLILDAALGSITDPLVLDRELNWIPGVVENGLFTGIADEVLFADPDGAITVMETAGSPAGRPTTTVHGRRTTGT